MPPKRGIQVRFLSEGPVLNHFLHTSIKIAAGQVSCLLFSAFNSPFCKALVKFCAFYAIDSALAFLVMANSGRMLVLVES